MEVAASVLQPLQFLATLSDERFSHIMDAAVLGLLEESAPAANDALDKILLASIATLIVESFSQNISPSALITFLEERGLTASQKEIFRTKLDASYSRLRDHLKALVPTGEPCIVDVDWRLNYLMRSNEQEKDDELSYLISLKTLYESSDAASYDTKDVKFTCSLHQLQDLVSKLREAYKNVEKLGSVTSL